MEEGAADQARPEDDLLVLEEAGPGRLEVRATFVTGPHIFSVSAAQGKKVDAVPNI
jgi:hypothetical protein